MNASIEVAYRNTPALQDPPTLILATLATQNGCLAPNTRFYTSRVSTGIVARSEGITPHVTGRMVNHRRESPIMFPILSPRGPGASRRRVILKTP